VSRRPLERTTRTGEAYIAWLDRQARRRRRHELGLDRFGRPLPRTLGTNPRARGTNPRALGTNPRALRAGPVDVVQDGRTLEELQLGRQLGWAA
jgi:hypothetical protein